MKGVEDEGNTYTQFGVVEAAHFDGTCSAFEEFRSDIATVRSHAVHEDAQEGIWDRNDPRFKR